ncbi:hypothetical protein PILCRDRAFT_470924 [Piloderma croceum F 1598]|uniref:Uncharacterized protein n=1 Tax=Piloderma croceum (strain F 1598) TaxID=765440 RepID=A0A0C3FR76_PILCF|nr:hypothetical protein PILCRDRAFT_470924 [Piloderma croceum F 1598]
MQILADNYDMETFKQGDCHQINESIILELYDERYRSAMDHIALGQYVFRYKDWRRSRTMPTPASRGDEVANSDSTKCCLVICIQDPARMLRQLPRALHRAVDE